MTKKPENPIEPGVTGKGVPLSQLDTTGYDFGGTLSEEQIEAELDAMESEFATIAMEDDSEDDKAT